MAPAGCAEGEAERLLTDAELAAIAEDERRDELRRVLLQKQQQKRALQAAQGKALLGEQLETLDRTSKEVLDRWSRPSDFAKVDLVCAELVRKGSFVDAVRYMERVRALVDTVLTKLRQRALAEGADPADLGLVPDATTEALLRDAALAQARAAALGAAEEEAALSKTKAVKATPTRRKPRDAEDPKERVHQLQQEAFELTRQVKELEKSLAEERSEHRAKDASLRSTRERLNARSMEVTSATNRATLAERKAAELGERVEGLTSLLKAADAKAKQEAARARAARDRLAVAPMQLALPPPSTTATLAAQPSAREEPPADPSPLPPIDAHGDKAATPLDATSPMVPDQPEPTPMTAVEVPFNVNSASRAELKSELERRQTAIRSAEAIAAKARRAATTASKRLALAIEALRAAGVELPDGVDVLKGAFAPPPEKTTKERRAEAAKEKEEKDAAEAKARAASQKVANPYATANAMRKRTPAGSKKKRGAAAADPAAAAAAEPAAAEPTAAEPTDAEPADAEPASTEPPAAE